MGSGEEWRETLILVNGRIARLMATEFMCGKTGIDMKESGRHA